MSVLRLVYCLVAFMLPLSSAGVLAAELDEVTLEVIDAGASSVKDVMRNIEIPQYDRRAGRESGRHPLIPVETGNGARVDPAERGGHGMDERGEDRRERAEDSHTEGRDDAEESHDEAREEIEEVHDEAVEDHEDAIEDHEDAHDGASEESDDVEMPEAPEEHEEHESPEAPED